MFSAYNFKVSNLRKKSLRSKLKKQKLLMLNARSKIPSARIFDFLILFSIFLC